MKPRNLQDAIQKAVAKELNLNEHSFELLPTQGNNLSGKISADNECYFVKCFTTDPFAQVDRHHQFRLQRQVSAYDLAPQPLLLKRPDFGGFYLQVEEWIESIEVSKSSIKDFALLGKALASVHECRVAASTLDLQASWQQYLSCLPENTEKQGLRERMATLIPLLASSTELCLCHNDMHLSHLLKKPTGHIRLLDWEYAAIGNPYFDLAACLSINDCNPQQRAALLDAYAQARRRSLSFVEIAIDEMAPVVALTNELWYAAKQATDRLSAQLTVT